MDFHGPRNVWDILQVNWEAAALQSNWFQDGFRCRTDSTRCFMIRNWDIWIHEIDAKDRCWFRLHTKIHAWLVWFHGNEVAGRSTFAAFAIYICSLQIFPTQTLGRWFSWGFRHLKKTHVFHGFDHGFCGTLWHDGMTSINLLLKTSRLRTNLQAAQHSELWTWQAYMHQMSNSLRRLSPYFQHRSDSSCASRTFLRLAQLFLIPWAEGNFEILQLCLPKAKRRCQM